MMIKEVPIGISARHIHLTKETYAKLFTKELTFRNNLNQPGEYATNETVIIKGPKGQLENVRLIGPLRKYDQVEISKSDARVLGLNPPVRKSGDLRDAEKITLITPKSSLEVSACIIPERHLHLSTQEAKLLGLKDGQKIKLSLEGIKSGIIDIYVKTSAKAYFEVHLDTDDANAFLINNQDKGKLIL